MHAYIIMSKDWKTITSMHFGAEGAKPQKVVESVLEKAAQQEKESSPWYMSWVRIACVFVYVYLCVCVFVTVIVDVGVKVVESVQEKVFVQE